jgi:hypothetical protein
MLNSRRDDTGLYTLRVDNEHGSDSADVSVVVMVPIPRNVSSSSPTAGQNKLGRLTAESFSSVDVTYEMRTVLYRIRLFDDDQCKHGCCIYMKRKEGEREQDSGETEKERV